MKNRIREPIPLSEVKSCPMASNYYHKFRGPIAGIRSLAEGEDMLSALKRDRERYSEFYPDECDEIHETYQLLKKKCLQAMRELRLEELE